MEWTPWNKDDDEPSFPMNGRVVPVTLRTGRISAGFVDFADFYDGPRLAWKSAENGNDLIDIVAWLDIGPYPIE